MPVQRGRNRPYSPVKSNIEIAQVVLSWEANNLVEKSITPSSEQGKLSLVRVWQKAPQAFLGMKDFALGKVTFNHEQNSDNNYVKR